MKSSLSYNQQVIIGITYVVVVALAILDAQYHFSLLRFPFSFLFQPWQSLELQLNTVVTFPKTVVQTVLSSQKMIADLQSKNAQLQVQVAQAEHAQRENEALRQELEKKNTFKNEIFNTIVLAQIIKEGELSYLDKGQNDGIDAGAFVMSQEVLLGKVKSSEPFFSSVISFSQGSWQTVAQTQNGVKGVVTGKNGQVVFTQVSADETLEKGDQLFTLGSVAEGVPPELYIGQVQDIIEKVGSPVQSATVDQGLRLDSLKVVMVKMRE